MRARNPEVAFSGVAHRWGPGLRGEGKNRPNYR